MDDDKYPHWKDALFGDNNAVANIRCAIHYVFWHSAYALLGFFGLILVGVIRAGEAIAPYLGPLASPVLSLLAKVGRGVSYVMDHRYTLMVFDAIVTLIGIAMVVGMVGGIIWLFIIEPMALLFLFGMIIIAGVAVFGGAFLAAIIEDPAKNAASGAAQKARRAGEKATKTPGIRRVYGECPVSMDQAPMWFDDLFNDEEDL